MGVTQERQAARRLLTSAQSCRLGALQRLRVVGTWDELLFAYARAEKELHCTASLHCFFKVLYFEVDLLLADL